MATVGVDQLAQALNDMAQLVAGVGDEQWGATTPCSDWTVRDLLNHFVGGNLLFAEVLRGSEQPLPELRSRLATDHLGDDPQAPLQQSAAQLVQAFQLPGVLEEQVILPIGACHQVPPSTRLSRRQVTHPPSTVSPRCSVGGCSNDEPPQSPLTLTICRSVEVTSTRS